MTCDEIRDLLELYSLGILDAEEHTEIDEHLRSGCPICNRNVRTARALNAAILNAAPEAQPSASLRGRVISLVQPGRRRASVWGWVALSGALAAGLAGVAIDSRNKSAEITEARRQRDASDREAQRLNAAFQFLRDPQTRPANAAPGANQPRGTYFISPAGVLLIASNLRPLTAGQTYEMWVIPKGQAPRPAGLFRPDNAGGVVHFQQLPVNVGATAAVAISVEPASGSPAPTTTPLLVTPVSGA